MTLLLFIGAVFGFAWGVGHAGLSYPIRKRLNRGALGGLLVELLECVGCLGFWTGVASVWSSVAPQEFPRTVLGAGACGLFVAATNLVLGKFVGLLDHRSE